MISAVNVYEVFCKAIGEEAAKVLVSYLEEMEKRKAATSEELRETELRLRKEIEELRLEIEHVRSELRETELRLQKQIEGIRLEVEQVRSELRREIEKVRLEVERVKSSLIKWMFAFWTGQVLFIATLFRYFLS